MGDAGTGRFKPNEACRHAFATHHAAKAFLQQYLGHADHKTTDRYVEISGAHLRGVVDV